MAKLPLMPSVEVTRTYLELTDPGDFRPARLARPGLRLDMVTGGPPDLYRFLYGAVGGPYSWVDRQDWTDEEITSHLARTEITLWVLRSGEEIAGYFELAAPGDGSVEIAYFGLVGEYIGQGLGKHLLTLSVEQAWRLGASRVWLHTCSLDHPAALPNYLKRGFRPFRTETYIIEAPENRRPVAG